MTIVASTGQRVLKPVKLSTTSATVIATAAQKSLLTIDSIWINCDTGGSTLDLYVTDGTNSYYLIKGKTIAANTYEQVKDHHIPLYSGWSLRAVAGTANRIDITAVLFQSNQSS